MESLFIKLLGLRPPRLLIGQSRINQKSIYLPPELITHHQLCVGGTGQGKSRAYAHQALQLIQQNIGGGLLVDPHGSAADLIFSHLVGMGKEGQVIYLSAKDLSDYAWALNPLERLYPDQDVVGETMAAIAKAFNEQDWEEKPRYVHWLRLTLQALHRGTENPDSLPLSDMLPFVSIDDPSFRKNLIAQNHDPILTREWKNFESLRKQEKATYLEAVWNRSVMFCANEITRRIFGQAKSTINIAEAMEKKKWILLNLNSPALSEELQNMIGRIFIDRVKTCGLHREPDTSPPFFVFIDEGYRFLSQDILKAFQQLRKFRVFFRIALQSFADVFQQDHGLAISMLANCEIKLIFKISYECAKILAQEMFVGQIRADRIKEIEKHLVFRPIETTRTIRTDSESYTHITTSSHQWASGQSFPASNYSAVILSEQTTRGQTFSDSDTSGSSVAEVPWYSYEELTEEHKVYFTPEELKEKFIAWCCVQRPQTAQLKIKHYKPIPITIPTIYTFPVLPQRIETSKKTMYPKYTRPSAEVDQEIEARWEEISRYQPEDEPELLEENEWE